MESPSISVGSLVHAMIESLRGFICGNTGTGKSTRAWSLYLSKAPRVLLLDQTGEWKALADASVYTVRDAVEAMRAFSNRGRWTITLALDPAELPLLVRYLIPIPDITRSPVLAMGGMWLLVDEVDLVAPQGPPPEHIRTLYRRGRHAGLSVLSLTQRPENVCREVTALSSHFVALQLTEPRAHDYVRKLMRWTPAELTAWVNWTRVHKHGGAWKDIASGATLWLPEAGPPSRVGPRMQLELSDGHSEPASGRLPPDVEPPSKPASASGRAASPGRAAPRSVAPQDGLSQGAPPSGPVSSQDDDAEPPGARGGKRRA